MLHWSRSISPITEKYGEVIVPKIVALAHKDENVMGVFYYNANDKQLIYSDEYKSHAEYPDHDTLVNLPSSIMLLRGRIVKADDKVVAMIYLAGDERDPSQAQIADMLHQIVRKTGFPIEYVVDDMGRSLLSEKVLEELKA